MHIIAAVFLNRSFRFIIDQNKCKNNYSVIVVEVVNSCTFSEYSPDTDFFSRDLLNYVCAFVC